MCPPDSTRSTSCPGPAANPRAVRVITLLVALAASIGLCGLASAARAANDTGSNWAGYVASAAGVRFTSARARWVQPAVRCAGGVPTYMASWVGLGGEATSTLEQIGTEADCNANGQATYSSWFELVPSISGDAHLAIQPGDVISASVTLRGHVARLRLRDDTRGTRFARQLTTDSIDASSAEWVVETPTVCATATAGCQLAELSDFGSIRFSHAQATAAGRAGGIAGGPWSAVAYATSGGPPSSGLAHAAGPRTGAVPGSLTEAGDAFTVAGSLPRPPGSA